MLQFSRVISSVDAHTAGEPLRIITSGLPPLAGGSMLERRRFVLENHDDLRKLLMLEPRGHSGMYGCIITPPATEDGDFGVLFMHNEGYSTMCGHGIIAVTKTAVETGMISARKEKTVVRIDSPAGRITATATMKDDSVESVSFESVPSFVYAEDVGVKVDGVGEVAVDISFGGAFYAFVEAERLGVRVVPEELDQLVKLGMEIKYKIMAQMEIVHPLEEELQGIYGTIIVEPVRRVGGSLESRNVTIFADAQIDRSPTGTGTAARLALLHHKGLIGEGTLFTNKSVIDTVFKGYVKRSARIGDTEGVIPEVSGTAHIMGFHQFVLESDDPLPEGFRITKS